MFTKKLLYSLIAWPAVNTR